MSSLNQNWPKLLITCDTTTGTSYWNMKSQRQFHDFCLGWLQANIDTGYYIDSTTAHSFVEWVMQKYGMTESVAVEIETLVETGVFSSMVAHWTIQNESHKLLQEAEQAVLDSDGEVAYKILTGFSELYSDDILGKDYFELKDFS